MMGIQINSFFLGECRLKKNQSAPRLSERPPVRGGKMSNDISTDFISLVLDQLSRKLDANRTTVKIC